MAILNNLFRTFDRATTRLPKRRRSDCCSSSNADAVPDDATDAVPYSCLTDSSPDDCQLVRRRPQRRRTEDIISRHRPALVISQQQDTPPDQDGLNDLNDHDDDADADDADDDSYVSLTTGTRYSTRVWNPVHETTSLPHQINISSSPNALRTSLQATLEPQSFTIQPNHLSPTGQDDYDLCLPLSLILPTTQNKVYHKPTLITHNQCLICQYPLQPHQHAVVGSTCPHIFHQQCLLDWLCACQNAYSNHEAHSQTNTQTNKCPTCRQPFTTNTSNNNNNIE